MAQISTWIRKMVPGRQISAKVLTRKSNGITSLDIGGQKVDARLSRPMEEGETVRMRVTHADPSRIALKELTFADQPVGRYLMALRSLGRQGPFQYLTSLFDAAVTTTSAPASKILDRLHKLVSRIAIRPGQSSSKSIQEMVQGSGLMHEKQLLDGSPQENIKSLTLELQKATPEKDPASKAVKALIDGMEKLQIINRATSETSGRILLPLPLFMDGGLTFGQLLVDRGSAKNRKKDPESQLTRFALQLKLSRFGEMRMEMAVLKNAVTGTVLVSDAGAEESLRREMEGLGSALQKKGFFVRRLTIERVPEEALAGKSLVDDLVEGFYGGG